MYQYLLHQKIKQICNDQLLDIAGIDHAFYIRLVANANTLQDLYNTIYGNQKNAVQDFEALLVLLIESYKVRKPEFKKRDQVKEEEVAWFTSNQITGMSLYVDRFAGSLKNMPNQLPYLQELGINFTLDATISKP